jgi:transcriptional regulator with XRE-family HTH domain
LQTVDKTIKVYCDQIKRLAIFDNICQVNIFKLKTSGEIIREKREKKGLLLRHVSAQLDIDTAILSKIERGERKATKEQINKLADILDLDKESLLIQYLSERILNEVQDEDLALQAMHVAEQKIKYKKKNDKH